MSKVRLLDKHTAELIAAGEVVDRPSSVIKELVENAIDAGATVITVEIKNGGVSFIRITDNGSGISPEDVPTAFLRHATSKITCGDDLDSILTLGFRGEALASVCAVARVEMTTRTADNDYGIRYVIAGSDEVSCEETGCPVGTTIIVRDLFYNTPARMKFLKRDISEGNACAACLDRIALSHPEISFRFIREGKESMRTPGDGQLKSAVYAIYGREFTSGLIPVSYSYNNVKVSGFISKPVNSRPNRSMQIFFINGRYVRSKTMQAALEEGFRGSIMVGKFPSCILGVGINCSAVDVNVHPAKLEVRFTNERPIFEAVMYAVRSALQQGDERKSIQLPEKRAVSTRAPFVDDTAGAIQAEIIPNPTVQNTSAAFGDNADIPAPIIESMTTFPVFRAASLDIVADDVPDKSSVQLCDSGFATHVGCLQESPNIIPPAFSDYEPPVQSSHIQVPEEKVPPLQDDILPAAQCSETSAENSRSDAFVLAQYRIIGELFSTYILIECGEDMILIDKHAAHERLIYERLLETRDCGQSQMLIAPVTVTLDKMLYDTLLENLSILTEAGFDVEDFGTGCVIVRAVPMLLGDDNVEDAIYEIAGNIGKKRNAARTEHIEHMFHTIACKAAIKAGDTSLPQELAELVLRLEHNPDVRYCPHGRPISIKLTRREIEKSFGRLG